VTYTPPEPPSPPMIDFEGLINPLAYREPRCRICRDEDLRARVDALLQLQGIPVGGSRGRFRCITYTDVWRSLSGSGDGANAVSYSSVVNHGKRHYGRSVTPEVAGALFGDMLIRALDVDDNDGS
jgi:hypothetical protein